ncbi:hypothetical protein NQ315_004115 [Exocentrus adspersus]|uniref:BPTI/Kunitz inhibitor domain-containing protein n=1 Tax=Exocentrus adspersus TaxID=1586481 RepID=A0AAV8W6C2_9CUCU|nr:hypothetical protein NQ315_004115 [Exocentrus adspersus]
MTSKILIPSLYLILQVCNGAKFRESDCFLTESFMDLCKADIPVYRWDMSLEKCIPVTYGGCAKTNNNFVTKQKCQKAAEPICKRLLNLRDAL